MAAAETSPVMPRSSDACQTVIVRNVRWVVAKMLPAFYGKSDHSSSVTRIAVMSVDPHSWPDVPECNRRVASP